jgi:signal peptidase II
MLKNRYKLAILLAFVILAGDVATKYAVVENIGLHGGFNVFPGFNLVHVTNSGAAFGFLAGAGGAWRTWFFVIAAVLAIIVIFYLLKNEASESRLMAGGLGLVLGGAIGNLIDRIGDGLVVDFVDLYIGQYHWPAFNVADMGITAGAVLFIISFYQRNRRRRKT